MTRTLYVLVLGEEQTKHVPTITLEEYQTVVNFFQESEDLYYLALPVQIAFHTGMRVGEVCELTWDDIDFQNQCLYVRRSMYYDNVNKCWELKVPKNGKPRVIDFGNQLTAILKRAKKEQLERQFRFGNLYQRHFYQSKEIKGRQHVQIFTQIHEDIKVLSSRSSKGKFIEEANPKEPLMPISFVCSKPDGELLTTQTLKYLNKVVQKELPEISHFHFHCLRHSYASTLVNNGANFKDVQELMGHSDIKITLNTYSHVTPHSRKKAVGIFESAIQ